MTSRRRLWLWLCWLALVFGVLNIYGPPIESFRKDGDPPSVSTDVLSQRTSFLDRILLDLRDDFTPRFYHSAAQATLGRPYEARYVPVNPGAGAAAAGKTSAGGGAVDDRFVVPPRPLVPWRDFLFEYPPGALAAILLPSLFVSDMTSYLVAFNLEMEAFLTLAVVFAVRTADRLGADGTKTLAQSLLLTAALGVIAVRRFDPCVAFAISGAIYALAARRPGLFGTAFAFGVVLKGVPIVLAPLFALWFFARRDWRGFWAASASFALIFGVIAIGYLTAAGPHALDSFAYHADRPIQMESIYGAFLMEFRTLAHVSIEHSFGSYNIVSPFEPPLRSVAALAVVCGLLVAWAWGYRRIRAAKDDRERLIAVILASSACLVAVISLGKVSNASYLVWLIPVGALAGALSAGDGRWRLVIACALAQVVYPFLYTTIIAGRLPLIDGVIIFARDFCLWRWIFKIAADPLAPLRARGEEGVERVERENAWASPEVEATATNKAASLIV